MAQIIVKNGLSGRFNLAYFVPPFCQASAGCERKQKKKMRNKISIPSLIVLIGLGAFSCGKAEIEPVAVPGIVEPGVHQAPAVSAFSARVGGAVILEVTATDDQQLTPANVAFLYGNDHTIVDATISQKGNTFKATWTPAPGTYRVYARVVDSDYHVTVTDPIEVVAEEAPVTQ
jgi:hypothetical protein